MVADQPVGTAHANLRWYLVTYCCHHLLHVIMKINLCNAFLCLCLYCRKSVESGKVHALHSSHFLRICEVSNSLCEWYQCFNLVQLILDSVWTAFIVNYACYAWNIPVAHPLSGYDLPASPCLLVCFLSTIKVMSNNWINIIW